MSYLFVLQSMLKIILKRNINLDCFTPKRTIVYD